ncbi:FAD-binding protein [Ancylobacter sonchi]|uniref:FAD-dependent oxidoreductase n=1 Tax=Ancylobacter sonchi TaxID=1937790 RepID=UPI001BD5AB0F|nr:FAD-binding protein [Ancylobacter sonchi]MBS7535203.1 FAD-binding protein [Ancylobacter sonchi]
MPQTSLRRKSADRTAPLNLEADVLVLGGGPAGAWAAVTAAENGRRVVLADKGYFGTSGATAPSNTGTWCVPPGEARAAQVERRAARAFGLADPHVMLRMLDTAHEALRTLGNDGYPFPRQSDGELYIANLRGPDYMRHMRRLALKRGVTVLDHHPALELLGADDAIVGAAGWDRQQHRPWQVTAGAVVLATGGCAFGERMLGATGLTGDGYLMAAEAGASLSGMEFCGQYGVAPAGTSLNKGLPYRWASFFDVDGEPLDMSAGDRHVAVAKGLLRGPVFASLDKAGPEIQDWLRRGQPNCFLPFDRIGLNPFTQRFEITLRGEGTVRGVGGIRLVDEGGWTGIPGLYAAGDAASREDIAGAVSGGGGPNASWAIASGRWAGAAAARTALSSRRDVAGKLRRLGGIGLVAHSARPEAEASIDVVAAVREEMLSIDRNFFRTGPKLRCSLSRLDGLWRDARAYLAGEGAAAIRTREAGALLASSRWALAGAVFRNESRGLHRRSDAPESDPNFAHRVRTFGLDEIGVALDRAIHAAPLQVARS